MGSQKKLTVHGAKWTAFLQVYTSLHNKARTQNKEAYALSSRAHILRTFGVEVSRLEVIREEYYDDPAFIQVLDECVQGKDHEVQNTLQHRNLFKGMR